MCFLFLQLEHNRLFLISWIASQKQLNQLMRQINLFIINVRHVVG